jgi:hypothetical protein
MEQKDFAEVPQGTESTGSASLGLPNEVSEKSVPQSKVNEILVQAKQEARERGKREALDEINKIYSQAAPPPTSSSGALDTDSIRRLVQDATDKHIQSRVEEHEQELVRQESVRMAEGIKTKLAEGASRYPDFEQVVIKELSIPKMASILRHTEDIDNLADVMYHLATTPGALANMQIIADNHPQKARSELKRIAALTKLNEDAKNFKFANEPLSQMSPSIIGTDNGNLTLRDMKRQNWARG